VNRSRPHTDQRLTSFWRGNRPGFQPQDIGRLANPAGYERAHGLWHGHEISPLAAPGLGRGGGEVPGVPCPSKVLAQQPREKQDRRQWTMIHHEMLRLPLWVPVDDSDVCDRLSTHLRCVVLSEAILSVITEVDEVLVRVAEAEGFEPPVPLGTLAFKLWAPSFIQGSECADVQVACELRNDSDISYAPEPGRTETQTETRQDHEICSP
jgi:hypothetical protein